MKTEKLNYRISGIRYSFTKEFFFRQIDDSSLFMKVEEHMQTLEFKLLNVKITKHGVEKQGDQEAYLYCSTTGIGDFSWGNHRTLWDYRGSQIMR